MKKYNLLLLLIALSLVIVACGPSETETTAPVEEAPTEVAEEEAPAEEMEETEEMAEEPMEEEAMESNTIVDIAVADGNFNTLVAAVQAAGLAETLAGEGPFTVLAPTDDAFAALPEGTVESLLEDPSGALTDILLYHVIDGAAKAETVVTLDSATTLQGEAVAITVSEDQVFLNDNVLVTVTDIEADNGVIHVIDAVLLPPSIANADADTEEAMEEMEEEMAELPSIAEIAVENGNFNTLVAALDAAGLVETMAGEGAFTVFAPTDDAFAALPEGTVEGLLEDPEGLLTDVLLYHVVDGVVPAETVVGLDAATTLNGEDVAIAIEDGNVVLNGAVMVVTTDIEASNGIIHVIDAVLLPSSVAAADSMDDGMMEEDMADLPSIVEIAVEDGSFTTLVAALEAANLVETLSGEGPFTVFAPTDDAFAALPEGTVEGLLEDPEGDLTNILLYHVVSGAVKAEDVITLSAAPTLQEQEVTITVDEDGNVFLNDSVQVIVTDIVGNNGVIHVIDAVLLPAG